MPGPKLNNRRIYPNANHQPCQKAAARVGRAQARQEIADGLTLEQKLAKLPPEPLCAKQRARYTAQLAKRSAAKSAPQNEAPQTESTETVADKPQPKKYMKGSN